MMQGKLCALFTGLILLLVHPTVATPGITGALLVNAEGQPDPCIFHDSASGTYYCYADAGRLLSSKQVNDGWHVESNYTVLTNTGEPWQKDIGAPSVGYLNDKYVLYFSSEQKIQVGTASTPQGPFTLESQPLLVPKSQPGTSSGKIAFPAAPALFQHQGNNYMLYKYGRAADYNHVSSIQIITISADGLTTTGNSTEIFTVTNGKLQDGRQFTEDEGPNMVYNNGTFYLFFNAGTWCASDYQIVYATSSTLQPAQPYNYQGVFLQTSPPKYNGVALKAPGGISFVDPTTFIFMSYEPNSTLACAAKTHAPRYIHAGQLTYETNGTIALAGSWTD